MLRQQFSHRQRQWQRWHRMLCACSFACFLQSFMHVPCKLLACAVHVPCMLFAGSDVCCMFHVGFWNSLCMFLACSYHVPCMLRACSMQLTCMPLACFFLVCSLHRQRGLLTTLVQVLHNWCGYRRYFVLLACQTPAHDV